MIKVLIVDDIKILRECLRLTIEKEDEFQVIGCASNGKEAVHMTLELNPDIILMDLNMPIYSGYEAIKDIKALQNNTSKILVLTVEGDEKNITQAFVNGADGYILKDICPEDLSTAIWNTYNGIECIHDSAFNIGSGMMNADPENHGDIYLHVKFTAREKEVLELLVEGMTNEEIAEILGISGGRARNIVAELISKCMVKNRTQLAVIATRIMMLATSNK